MRSLVVSTVSLVLCVWAGNPVLLAQTPQKSITFQGRLQTSDEIYVVKSGDTLWDICQRHFGQPWYWPTLWSYNPHITNPHWIYPGDIIYLKPKGYKGSSGVVSKWMGSRYNMDSNKFGMVVRRYGFISPKMVKDAGKITHSREEKFMFGDFDEVYAKFENFGIQREQQRYTIFRVLRKVYEPYGKKRLIGYHIENLGIARMVKKHRYVGSLILEKTYKEIHRGDLLGAYFEHQSFVKSRPSTVNRAVRIVAVHRYGWDYYAKWGIVFLDAGARQGLKRGYRCKVMERNDPVKTFGKDKKYYPWEPFGELTIVSTLENTAMAIVSGSIKEITVGNPCWFRRGH
ncbi:MAG: LysM peptidoglycan-binding domain-containing protein [Myxococcales bacterium]|nr:LysM peptidoglycan-binding domain-containing protein [Myxococcales bacterium]